MKVLSCDGTGYGTDGRVWGGEILDVNMKGFERLGHLKYIPLLGGDKAVEDPRRIVYAITSLLDVSQPYFSGQEETIMRSMMEKSIKTSSTGRVLDALSCWLGVCERMTYDGEPAMKLESYLRRGRVKHQFDAPVNNGIIDTLELFDRLNEITGPGERLEAQEVADISHSFVDALCEALIKAADPTDMLGFTGGVSYNLVMNDILRKKLDERGVKLIIHRRVPNGDGGISFGQLVGGI